MDLQHILTPVIIFVAFFCESIFGMGGGFISIPLLSILLGPKTAILVVLIFQFLMGFLIFSTRKYTNWKLMIPMTVTLVIGTVIGTYLLSIFDDEFLRKFLAITILIFLAKMIFFPKITFGNKPSRFTGFLVGLVGGWFQGITGNSSPIFVMYLTNVISVKSVMRATLIYIFFATSVARVIVSFSQNLFTENILSFALPAIPFFFLAIFLGHHVHKKLDEKYYRYTLYIILFFSAVLMLSK